MTKLWHDDIRRPPDDSWIWARTNQDAQLILRSGEVDIISMDHDLGLHNADPDVQDADMQRGWDEENDGYTLAKWMVEENFIPDNITIHSWNPYGAKRMANKLAEANPQPYILVKPYLPK
jgi:hypothetical protein